MKYGRTKYKILKSNDLNNGFGIVEVLVAMALLSIMAVGISGLLTGAMKSQKGIQAKDQQREVTAEIRSLLSNKTACFNSFGTKSVAAPFTVNTIFDGAPAPGNAKYIKNTPDKTGLLTFTDFAVDNYVPDVVAGQGLADFKVKLAKVGDTGTSKDIRPDVITLKIKITAGNITECYSIGSQSDSYWQMSPTVPNAIYYAGGSVGIDVPAPTVSLDVNGGIKATTSLTGASFVGGTFTGASFAGGTFTGASFAGGTFTGTSFAGGSFGGTSFLYTSDSRLKKNIFKLTDGLDLVSKMKPVRYQWKATSKDDIGFIAQDIEKILPELTSTDTEGIKRIDYAKMVPILVKAIQQQQIQIEKLQKKLND